MKRLKKVSITEELLLDILTPLFELPEDAQIVESKCFGGEVRIIIYSDKFAELPGGCELPTDYA